VRITKEAGSRNSHNEKAVRGDTPDKRANKTASDEAASIFR
jgi:hypothetical protein